MRATLSPSFTSSKMKQMFHLMTEVGENFIKYFEKNPTECVDVDMKDVLTRYTNDIIGTVAFGIRCDSLKDKNNEFYMMGKEATNFNNVWKNLQFFLMIISTKLAKVCLFKVHEIILFVGIHIFLFAAIQRQGV